jgi:tetratricopeptide (TPR) repeat protein
MADRAQFDTYMDEGHNAAWDRDWPAAIKAYSKALRLQPEDPEAHTNLGLALLNDRQLDRALKVYKRAHQLSPDDPLPLERSADVLERMGRLKEAAHQYVKVSDIYLSQRDLNKAIGNWERATQLTPGLIKVHSRLARAYERIGDTKKSIREYLTLAFNFRRQGDTRNAIRAVERALRQEKDNPQALNTLRALKSGGDVNLPEEITSRDKPETPKDEDEDLDPFGMPRDDAQPDVGEAHPLGPMGEALNEAMSILAEYVVESGLGEHVMYAMQAMGHQRQDKRDQAVEAYRQAEQAGLRTPALKMNLGGLLVLEDEPEEAIDHLKEAIGHNLLTAGAYHALGQAYYKVGKHKDASHNLTKSLQAVDTDLAMDESEVEELTQVYRTLLTTLEGRSTQALQVINERFLGLLTGTDWKQRIAETRRHLDETLRDEGDEGLVEFLQAKGGDELTDIVSAVDRYIRQGYFTLAMDEAHRAVEKSGLYLPLHVRMAEIMMKEGRIRQAINKYNTVARSYMVRDENERAASILGEVLEMAPLDTNLRISLIELLESEDRWDDALEQYIDLAETYQQLGDFEMANHTFSASERLARRIDAPAEKLVSIKHSLADISQMRLNTRQAQKIYEDILEIHPQDEKARRELFNLYYDQGNQVEAIRQLDKLLSIFAKQRDVKKILSLLEELVSTYPNDTALRSRLASIYRRLKRRQDAIEQLDALGELQLDAGLTRDAAKTIRQIIALKPDQVDDYKRLLSQLNG